MIYFKQDKILHHFRTLQPSLPCTSKIFLVNNEDASSKIKFSKVYPTCWNFQYPHQPPPPTHTNTQIIVIMIRSFVTNSVIICHKIPASFFLASLCDKVILYDHRLFHSLCLIHVHLPQYVQVFLHVTCRLVNHWGRRHHQKEYYTT